MTPKERILALKLLEKQKQNPEYAKKIGVEVKMKKGNHYGNNSNSGKH